MRELSVKEMENVDGAVLGAVIWGLGYIGALLVAADIGAGIGIGLYDAIHE